jgi:hypothetical protein
MFSRDESLLSGADEHEKAGTPKADRGFVG